MGSVKAEAASFEQTLKAMVEKDPVFQGVNNLNKYYEYEKKSSKAKLAEKKVSAPKSGWTVSSSKDKMTGDTIFFAHSKVAYPSPKMEFPYSDINGWMGV